MKKVITIIIVVFCVFSAIRSAQEIISLLQKRSIVLQARDHLAYLQQKNAKLKSQMNQAQDPNFVQEQARDKLFLSLPNETRILVATGSGEQTIEGKPVVLPTWQQWLQSVHLCCGATIESGL